MFSTDKCYRYDDETEDIRLQLKRQSTAPAYPGLRPADLDPFLPMLITEIHQLTPKIGLNYVDFYPMNMPGYKIGKIGIMGIVAHKKVTAKQIAYIIDDSTGRIKLIIKRNIENVIVRVTKKREGEGNIPRSQKRPGYPHPCPVDVHQIHQALAVRRETAVQRYDYVVAWGYCTMEFERKKPLHELTKDDLKFSKIYLFGLEIRSIDQSTYLKDMQKIIVDHVQNRLIDSRSKAGPKAKPKALPKAMPKA